ncbi:MAG: hypothetical protein H8F28_22610 [Fibrella sp.]|nr:hypothetical protein [Armatimonadota bacterium]
MTILCIAMLFPLYGEAHAASHTILVIRRDTLDKLAGRITMDAKLRVAGVETHSPSGDGEAHIGGVTLDPATEQDFGFATVAELLQAGKYNGRNRLLAYLRARVGGDPIAVSGVWRFWSEHGRDLNAQGEARFEQGIYPPPSAWSKPSNPNHIFEIHPLTSLTLADGVVINLRDDFVFQEGYAALGDEKRTHRAFRLFPKIDCKITVLGDLIKIVSTPHHYNFLQFKARITAPPISAIDGSFWTADVFDQNGAGLITGGVATSTPLARGVRLAVTGGTPVAQSFASVTPGQTVKLVAFPRVNLEAVQRIADGLPNGATFEGQLPYELIVAYMGR